MVADIIVVIEAKKKGESREQNHLARILNLNKIEDLNKTDQEVVFVDNDGKTVLFYRTSGIGELLKKETYGAVIQKSKKIFFILDADDEFDNKKTKIQNLIEQLKSDNPELIMDYFISCDPETKSGHIERLLLKCLKEGLKECYNDFLDCIGKTKLDYYNEKMLLQKLFEVSNPPYDLNCEHFEPLREKFKSLILR